MMPPEEFMGQRYHEIRPPDVARQTDLSLERAHAEGTVQSYEYAIPMPQGRRDYEARVFAFTGGAAS